MKTDIVTLMEVHFPHVIYKATEHPEDHQVFIEVYDYNAGEVEDLLISKVPANYGITVIKLYKLCYEKPINNLVIWNCIHCDYKGSNIKHDCPALQENVDE